MTSHNSIDESDEAWALRYRFDTVICDVNTTGLRAYEQGNDRVAMCHVARYADFVERRLLECLHGSIVNRYEGKHPMTTATTDNLLKLCKIRNKSGFSSNLQFQIDCEAAGIKLADLGPAIKQDDGSYKWELPGGALVESGGKLEWQPLWVYLCMTLHSWGSDPTVDGAIKACRSYAGSSHFTKYGYAVWRVHRDFEVDQINGTIYSPKDCPAEKILDRVKRKKSTSK